ncbi:MAG: V-type ATPase subunit [Anaerolineales bacterium]
MLTGGASGYAAVQARVRVMYSTLLSPQFESRLCEIEDLPGLVRMLRETPYKPYLTDTEDVELTPSRTTHQIKNRLADVYQSIIRSAPKQARTLLIELFRHFEIDNLKAILRAIVAGTDREKVREILFPLGSLAVLPVERLLESETVENAIEQLARTPYYDTLSYAMKRYSEEHSLFPLEVALDLRYWRQLWNDASHLKGRDRSQALHVLGLLMDLNNLMWTLRYRVYHHLSEEEVINYTLPFGYHVRDDDIRSIAAGADITQVVERIYPRLDNLPELTGEPENVLPRLEIQLQRHFREQLNAVFIGYPFHLGLPLAYVLLLELELQDLTVLIEAKASQLPPEDFLPYILLDTSLTAEEVA